MSETGECIMVPTTEAVKDALRAIRRNIPDYVGPVQRFYVDIEDGESAEDFAARMADALRESILEGFRHDHEAARRYWWLQTGNGLRIAELGNGPNSELASFSLARFLGAGREALMLAIVGICKGAHLEPTEGEDAFAALVAKLEQA